MTVLAAYYLAGRIVFAVIRTDLPLGAQIFESEVAHILPTWVHVVLFRRQVPVGHSHVMARVAESACAQERDTVRVIAGNVEIVLDGHRKQKGPNFQLRL